MKNGTVAELKREIGFLYRVTQTVHSLEIEEALQDIVDIASEVTQADACLVYIFDAKKEELILRASKNPHPELLTKIKMKLGEGITGWVALKKQPVAIATGAGRDPRFKLFRNLPEDRFDAFLAVPILNKRGVVGVINVQHKVRHDHTEMEINLLSAIGRLVGGALENALLIEETLELKEALELRKMVEKAKGLVMKKTGLGEAEAYKKLQQESMHSGKALRDIVEAIILADKLNI